MTVMRSFADAAVTDIRPDVLMYAAMTALFSRFIAIRFLAPIGYGKPVST